MKKTKEKRSFTVIFIFSLLSFTVLVLAGSLIYRIFIHPPVESTFEENPQPANPNRVIQISILNGSGVNGIALKAKKFLRSRGFDVVEIGNYKDIVDQSIVIDRIGDISSAKKVAYAVGIPDSMVTVQIDTNLYLQSSVVLGKDYLILNPFK